MHKADAAAGGSAATGSFLVGPYGSFAHDLGFFGIKSKGFMVVGDMSNHLVGDGDEGVTKLVYTVGLRWWAPKIEDQKRWHTFVQLNAMFIRELKEGAATVTNLKPGLSLGVERELMWGVPRNQAATTQVVERPFAWRWQLDAYPASSSLRHLRTRITTGIVYRWHPPHPTED